MYSLEIVLAYFKVFLLDYKFHSKAPSREKKNKCKSIESSTLGFVCVSDRLSLYSSFGRFGKN